MTSGLESASRGPSQGQIDVEFTVRWRHVLSMYAGSWGAKVMLLPGLLSLWVVWAGSPYSPNAAVTVQLGTAALAATIAGPAAVIVLFPFLFGQSGAVGKRVLLRIDSEEVAGWPTAPSFDRSWAHVRRVRTLGGVLTLPFGGVAARYGWMSIPLGALSAQQREQLDLLLVSKGLAKAPRRRSQASARR